MMLLRRKINLSLIPKWIPILILILAIIGFADATYLTVEHYQNVIPPCTIGGCESVLTSQYSQVIGVPISLLGAVYCLILTVLLLLYLDSKKELFLRIASLLSILGAIVAIALLLVMAFVIKAFCPYCVVSDTISIIIFLVSISILKKHE